MRSIPEVPGVITAGQVVETARYIASLQLRDGMIEWFPGGHCDPWNHVESAMALTVAGMDAEADRAYQWLVDNQLPDGSWFNYYLATGIEDPRLDTNVCAYLATGAWHRYVSTGELDGLEQLWPTVEAGVDFVLRWQRPDGSIHWSVDACGFLEEYALLTGSSSMYHSLRCAIACAERLGHERPDWELAAGRLAHAVAHLPEAFAPKDEFAMDWYYPVLAGALSGEAAHRRMDEHWSRFVMDGRGVRCVSTGEWVTAAETAECILALDVLGRDDEALELMGWVQALRNEDGSYWTGMVYPEEATYPPLERSSYTAGAMILAADALSRTTPGVGDLPRGGAAQPPRPHRAGPRPTGRAGRPGSRPPRGALRSRSRPGRGRGPDPPGTGRVTPGAGPAAIRTRRLRRTPRSRGRPARCRRAGARRRPDPGTRRGWPASRP